MKPDVSCSFGFLFHVKQQDDLSNCAVSVNLNTLKSFVGSHDVKMKSMFVDIKSVSLDDEFVFLMTLKIRFEKLVPS